MDAATRLNNTLDSLHPAAGLALSALGRRMYFPTDIPSQSAEARQSAINATIGEVTDGAGQPLSLGVIAEHIRGLDPREVFLYAAQGGEARLRAAWMERLQRRGDVPLSLPVVTVGITHGLSVVADLFADENTDVLLPRPSWGNYRLIYGLRRGARIHTYPVTGTGGKDGGGLDLDGLAAALRGVSGKGVLILNFPGNPTGYSPTLAEVRALVDLIKAQPGPLVVVLDDAYQDMSWEDGLMSRSVFYELADADPSRILAVKLDGATKEYFFFGARVGFITFGATGAAADALIDKARGVLRSSVSTVPTLSQTLVRVALSHPDTDAQRAAVLGEVKRRYQILKQTCLEQDLPTYPFNSGFFALVPVPGDPDALRRRLLAEASVGVVSFNEFGALRLSYGSIRGEDIPPLISAIRARI